MRLAELYRERFAKTAELTAEAAEHISDLQFTGAYRVPFQFSRFVRQHLKSGSFVQSSSGVMLTDLDGNQLYDLTGSYGVNVFGYDFYKGCMERGQELVGELGPVLGSYHPVVAQNVARLREISGLDEVSFHMSGTEAVMQAVRLARYHTRRTHLVRFCGAYHGWWGDVQPGIGNPVPAHETYTLTDMSERCAAGAAHAPRHRLRAGQSAAGAASQRRRAGRLVAGRQRAPRAFRQGGLHRLAQAAARGLHRARHRADLRRGVRRLPARARRRAGILRRPGRHGHLRQDAGRRAAGRRGLRAQAPDEALPRRSAGRHLLRARHLQLPSLRHGGDAGVPASTSTTPSTRELYRRPRRHLEPPRRAAQSAAAWRTVCRSRSPTCRRSGRSATRSRRATIGCCSITCGPRGWR